MLHLGVSVAASAVCSGGACLGGHQSARLSSACCLRMGWASGRRWVVDTDSSELSQRTACWLAQQLPNYAARTGLCSVSTAVWCCLCQAAGVGADAQLQVVSCTCTGKCRAGVLPHHCRPCSYRTPRTLTGSFVLTSCDSTLLIIQCNAQSCSRPASRTCLDLERPLLSPRSCTADLHLPVQPFPGFRHGAGGVEQIIAGVAPRS